MNLIMVLSYFTDDLTREAPVGGKVWIATALHYSPVRSVPGPGESQEQTYQGRS